LSAAVGQLIVRVANNMKTFVWLVFAGMLVLSLTLWGLAERVVQSWRGIFAGEELPVFSLFVLSWRNCIFLVPLPWVIYAAVLSSRQSVSVPSALTFAGTVLLGIIGLACIVLYGAILPDIEWGPHHRHPNGVTAPNAGIALRLQIEHDWPAVHEHDR
jgi:hypothetical protein